MAGGIAVIRPFVPIQLASDPSHSVPPKNTEELSRLYRETAGEAPTKIKKMMTILRREGSDKLVLVGGCIEESAFGPNMIQKVVCTMPSRSALHAQLLGLLQQPSSMLAQTLSHTPQMLSLTLSQHKENLEKSQ